MEFMTIFQQNKTVFMFMALVIAGTFIFNAIRMKKLKSSNRDFLQANPNAAKVYLTAKAFITSEAVTVISVDGEDPQLFMEGGKSGFYAVPGSRAVEMQYAYNRPGVIHKNVMTTYGPVKKELLIESGKSYILGFDRDAENFTFTEFAG
jgi:hypothetical protein